jgi:hypothetical protein
LATRRYHTRIINIVAAWYLYRSRTLTDPGTFLSYGEIDFQRQEIILGLSGVKEIADAVFRRLQEPGDKMGSE